MLAASDAEACYWLERAGAPAANTLQLVRTRMTPTEVFRFRLAGSAIQQSAGYGSRGLLTALAAAQLSSSGSGAINAGQYYTMSPAMRANFEPVRELVYTKVAIPPMEKIPGKRDLERKRIESAYSGFQLELKQAEQGSARAQYEVGRRYLAGECTVKDKAVGKEWLRKAAQQGHAEAKALLENQNAPPSTAAPST